MHAVISQPFATFTVISQTSLVPKITMKIQRNTFPAAKPKLLNGKRENPKIYQTKMARKKSQF